MKAAILLCCINKDKDSDDAGERNFELHFVPSERTHEAGPLPCNFIFFKNNIE